jgi:hypothetical protein
MDGRVLAEAFEPDAPQSRPVAYSQASVYKDSVEDETLTGDEMDEVQEKLRGWGYAG